MLSAAELILASDALFSFSFSMDIVRQGTGGWVTKLKHEPRFLCAIKKKLITEV